MSIHSKAIEKISIHLFSKTGTSPQFLLLNSFIFNHRVVGQTVPVVGRRPTLPDPGDATKCHISSNGDMRPHFLLKNKTSFLGDMCVSQRDDISSVADERISEFQNI